LLLNKSFVEIFSSAFIGGYGRTQQGHIIYETLRDWIKVMFEDIFADFSD